MEQADNFSDDGIDENDEMKQQINKSNIKNDEISDILNTKNKESISYINLEQR